MDNPKISVIVPVYNVEQYLHRCIDSILAQTFTDFELLLIDDGSKDRSGEICDDYAGKDERVRVFHKENGGVSSARNVGLDKAKGELLCFCDSDDFVVNDWLYSFIENIDGYELVVTGFYFVNGESKHPFNMVCDSCKPYKVADYLNYYENFGYLWCKCFRNDIIKTFDLKFNVNFSLMEDEDFVCRYFAIASKIKVINKKTYYYNKPDADAKYGGIDCFDVYYSLLNSALMFIDYRESASLKRYAFCLHRYLLRYYRDGKYLVGWKGLKNIAKIRNKKILMLRVRLLKICNIFFMHLFFMVYGKLKGKNN